MSTVNERIKILRKSLKLTQSDFGIKIETPQTTLARYENGDKVPKSILKLICYEFRASRKWLETGEGEMFEPFNEYTIEKYCREHGVSDIITKTMKAIVAMEPDTRELAVREFVKQWKNLKDVEDEAQIQAEIRYLLGERNKIDSRLDELEKNQTSSYSENGEEILA